MSAAVISNEWAVAGRKLVDFIFSGMIVNASDEALRLWAWLASDREPLDDDLDELPVTFWRSVAAMVFDRLHKVEGVLAAANLRDWYGRIADCETVKLGDEAAGERRGIRWLVGVIQTLQRAGCTTGRAGAGESNE